MAIDLFFYTSKSVHESESIMTELTARYPAYFPDKFLVSNMRTPNPISHEIALEYGLDAQCIFLVSVNDKGFAASIGDVAKLLKDAFGESETIVLFNNETLM